MRNHYKNSILSANTTHHDELLDQEEIERQIQTQLDPTRSKGFLNSFKETQAYLEYCDNVIRASQADIAESNLAEFPQID